MAVLHCLNFARGYVILQTTLSAAAVDYLLRLGTAFCRDRSSGGFRDRSTDGGDREDQGPSRADTDSNWGSSRKFEPSKGYDEPRGRSGFDDRPGRSRGFGDRDREFKDVSPVGPSRADQEDRWARKSSPSSEPPPIPRSGEADTADRWSRRAPLPADSVPSSAAPGGERKRLSLKPRTLPPPELSKPVAPAAAAADEEQQAAPAEQQQQQPPKPRSNPFGAARPREEVLKEQGRDWKKEDQVLEHSRVQR